jgi:hypothetical protein
MKSRSKKHVKNSISIVFFYLKLTINHSLLSVVEILRNVKIKPGLVGFEHVVV